MAERNIKSRIVLKHDIESNWKQATGFTPLNGEIVIYDPDATHSYSRVKIGNGKDNVNTLPFIDSNKADASNLTAHVNSKSNPHGVTAAQVGAPTTAEFIDLSGLVGDKKVSVQIEEAIGEATADDFGVYVQASEPTNAVAGDIWIDTANNPSYIAPTLPEVTQADNGKVLMVVNGRYQLVNLNLSIDANGVVSM